MASIRKHAVLSIRTEFSGEDSSMGTTLTQCCLPLVIAGASVFTLSEPELMPLYDFSQPDQAEAWRAIHDRVMGGVSRGDALPVEGAVKFQGELSLENNGGFASFRISKRLPDLSEYDGLRLKVRGDGQVYRLSLRPDADWDRLSWRAPFATRDGEWVTIDLAFEDFVPSWRGRLVASESRLDTSVIHQLGIMITDKQAGPFELELASIEGWRSKTDEEALPGSRRLQSDRTQKLAQALDAGAGASRVADALEQHERLLVVSAPTDSDADATIQIGHFLLHGEECAARELRIVNLMGTRGGRMAGRTLSSGQVAHLRELWKLPEDEWFVALVGKDGQVKARWTEIVVPEQVFERIDGMAMRKREIAERE